jgi:hypothetical protein
LRFAGGGGYLETELTKNALDTARMVAEVGSSWKASMVDVFSYK